MDATLIVCRRFCVFLAGSGIILWELNAYKKPFEGLRRESFYERVQTDFWNRTTPVIAVAPPPVPSQIDLVINGSPAANTCLEFDAELQDGGGQPADAQQTTLVSFNYTGGGTWDFYTDDGCANSTTGIIIDEGNSTGKFWFQTDTVPGDVEISTTTPIANDALTLPAGSYRIFIGKNSVADGNLGGRAGADAICQGWADAGSVTSPMATTWVALISTSGMDARDIFTQNAPLVDTFGNQISINVHNSQWPINPLDNAIDYDEDGNVGSVSWAWTGTLANGTYDATNNCNDWTDGTTSYQGAYGELSTTTADWIEELTLPDDCDYTADGLMCVTANPI